MSQLDGKLTAAGDAPLELAELLAGLEAQPGQPATDLQDWRDAIACYLAGGEGWRDASQRLGGAFASDADVTRLSGDKKG